MNTGRLICQVKGGEFDGVNIYLYDKIKCCEDCEEGNDECECCDECHNQYEEHKKEVKYCHLEDSGKFQQMPSNKETDVLMINGRRGVGKSYYLAEYMKEYIKLHPKNKIFLFSEKPKDEALDNLITKRIDLKSFAGEDALELDDFPDDCFVCFDDIDMLTDTKQNNFLRTKVFDTVGKLIQMGRSKNITVAQTSHLTTNHKETKNVLNGCSSFTFFYGAISHQVKKALEVYLGLSKSSIKKILSLKNSRFATIYTTVPMVIQTEKECFILED